MNLSEENRAKIERDYEILQRNDTLKTISSKNIDEGFGEFGASPLFYALYKKDFALVKRFMDLGADPNAYLVDNHTPLDIVITQENEPEYSTYKKDTLTLLLEKGADPNRYIVGTTESPLHYAIRTGSKELFDALLADARTDLNMQRYDTVTTRMVKNNYEHTVLVPTPPEQPSSYYDATQGKVVNLTSDGRLSIPNIPTHYYDPAAYTPLCCAILSNHELSEYFACSLLTKTRINLDSRDRNGNTPLHLAIMNKKKETAAQLLKLPIDVNTTDNYGYTALYLAIAYLKNEICLELLSRPEINLNSDKIAAISLPGYWKAAPIPPEIPNKVKEVSFKQIKKLLSQVNTQGENNKGFLNDIYRLTKIYAASNLGTPETMLPHEGFSHLVDLAVKHKKIYVLIKILPLIPYNRDLVLKIFTHIIEVTGEEKFAKSLNRVLSAEDRFQEMVYDIENKNLDKLYKKFGRSSLDSVKDSLETLEQLKFGASYALQQGDLIIFRDLAERIGKSNNLLKMDFTEQLLSEAFDNEEAKAIMLTVIAHSTGTHNFAAPGAQMHEPPEIEGQRTHKLPRLESKDGRGR